MALNDDDRIRGARKALEAFGSRDPVSRPPAPPEPEPEPRAVPGVWIYTHDMIWTPGMLGHVENSKDYQGRLVHELVDRRGCRGGGFEFTMVGGRQGRRFRCQYPWALVRNTWRNRMLLRLGAATAWLRDKTQDLHARVYSLSRELSEKKRPEAEKSDRISQ